ncbi:hypothetical protein K474DRAFT_1157678 [Panus rudis PR-1116 ss-1]|nr:hypothetical protein K474DRAFT_1157678 [Panus rudis PR-1116 ss-1]
MKLTHQIALAVGLASIHLSFSVYALPQPPAPAPAPSIHADPPSSSFIQSLLRRDNTQYPTIYCVGPGNATSSCQGPGDTCSITMSKNCHCPSILVIVSP